MRELDPKEIAQRAEEMRYQRRFNDAVRKAVDALDRAEQSDVTVGSQSPNAPPSYMREAMIRGAEKLAVAVKDNQGWRHYNDPIHFAEPISKSHQPHKVSMTVRYGELTLRVCGLCECEECSLKVELKSKAVIGD